MQLGVNNSGNGKPQEAPRSSSMKLLPLGIDEGMAIVLIIVTYLFRKNFFAAILLSAAVTYLLGSLLIHKFFAIKGRYQTGDKG